jgi:mxaJ protein
LFSASPLSLALLLLLFGSTTAGARELRVCADPNNMPFSNDREQGFENKIMSVVAEELGAELTYVWWAQRRGMITNALNEDECDLIPGLANIDGVLLTYPPYYRSTYSFVTRAGEQPVHSLDDPRLRTVKVGVELVGDDGANTPPAAALARRGITDNVRGFSIVGDYNQATPPARIIDAVADGTVDVAVTWGPLAGYFAKQEPVPLVVTPVAEQFDTAQLPMAFDISMGLRLDEGALRKDVEGAIAARKAEIDGILGDFGVPRLDEVAR